MITTAGVSDEETGKFRREGPAVDKNPASVIHASPISLIRNGISLIELERQAEFIHVRLYLPFWPARQISRPLSWHGG